MQGKDSPEVDGEQASRALIIADFIEHAAENPGESIPLGNAIWTISYLKPTAACHTNTRRKKNKGIKGRTSTVGAKALYASGSSANVLKKINTF